ncbi:hypothetical protein [Variovorax boronicumulans]|uniref:hypothetical protein n=1 Tax=Variovorax boronicumulans TaxID=436515 RepID=UPI00339B21AE
MDEKAVWGLAGAFLGWALSIGTAFVKEHVRVWRLAAGMRDELEDIDHQVTDMVESQRRNLQIIGAKGAGATGALPIQHVFFQKAYVDVFPQLGRGARLSLQLIHSAVDSLNEEARQLDEIFLELKKLTTPESEQAQGLRRQWEDLVKAAFSNAMTLRWYIAAHLQGRFLNPVKQYGHDHRQWLQHLEDVQLQIDKYIEEGKSIPSASFEKFYDEPRFEQNAAAVRTSFRR